MRLAEDGAGVHLAESSAVSACASLLAGPEFLPVTKCTSSQEGSGKQRGPLCTRVALGYSELQRLSLRTLEPLEKRDLTTL